MFTVNFDRIKQLSFLFILCICCSYPSLVQAQTVLKGTVTDSKQQPLSGINVVLQGTSHGDATNTEGMYMIGPVPPGAYTIVVMGVGFKTEEKKITLRDGQTLTINFRLSSSNEQLRQVIVNGEQTNKFAVSQSSYVMRIPLQRMETPQVYSTITKELLEEQLVFSVEDALQNAPGIAKMWGNTGRSGDGGSYYSMRGFIVQSQLRNGIAGNVSSRIDVVNLKRIEVIKGPSATLFGNVVTSYGGLINRVTEKPYKEFGGEVSFTAGNFAFTRISADLNTPLNAEENILLRLNAAYNYQGSFQDNGFDKNFAFTSSLSYKASEKLSFLVDAEFFTGKTTGMSVYFFPAGQTIASLDVSRAGQLNIDYTRSYMGNDLYQIARNINIFGQMDYEISDQWRLQTNVTVTNSYSDGPSPYYYLLSDAAVTGNPNDVGSNYISRNVQSTENSTDRVIEIQQNVIGKFATGGIEHRFVAGIDFFHHNSDQLFTGVTLDTIAVDGNIPNYRAFNRANIKEIYMKRGPSFYYPLVYTANTYSVYASDMISLFSDKLLLLAALRLDHFVHNGNFNANTGGTTGAYNQTTLSPKFGVVFQLIEDKISIFGNYQNSFTNKNGVDFEGNTFEPEQANQIEGGIKLNLAGGRLRTTLSYYDIQVKNTVRPDPEHPNFSIQNGTRVSRGFEVDLKANPVRGLNLVAGFAYNYSKYTKASADVVGRRPETASSPYLANFWISYRLTKTWAEGLGFGFGANYASDNKVINSASRGVFTLPAYTIFNASVFYDSQHFKIGIKANNLTNQKYWIGYTTVNPQMLRQVLANVTYKF